MRNAIILSVALLLSSCGFVDKDSDQVAVEPGEKGRAKSGPPLAGEPDDKRFFMVALAPSGNMIPVIFDLKNNKDVWRGRYLDLKDTSFDHKFVSGRCGAKTDDEVISIISSVACDKNPPFDIIKVNSTIANIRVDAQRRLSAIAPR